MKKLIRITTLLFFINTFSQVDYSDSWEDFFSYNNVKNFVKANDKIYAIVDNAVFVYDETSNETSKLSSVNGLSGETTTSIYYSEAFKRVVVGYATGLIEIIEESGEITIAPDITSFSLSTEKEITNIVEFNNKLYLSTPFAIVEYDIENLVFGDTFFIGNGSSEVKINEIKIIDQNIYAATENGIYMATILNPNLIDFNNWTRYFSGNFTSIEIFNDRIFTSRFNNLYEISSTNNLELISAVSSEILKIKSSSNCLSIATQRQAYFYNLSLNLKSSIISDINSEFYFELNGSYAEDETIYLATKEFGLLQSSVLNLSEFIEIHPEGPTSNDIFSISVSNNNLWVTYGGYDSAYTPLDNRFGFGHFNGEFWVNTAYNSSFPARNLVHTTIDPNHENRAYISSWSDGMLVVEDDLVSTLWNETNSGLENLDFPLDPSYINLRINGSAFDRQGNLWVANAWVDNKVKKYSPSGSWSNYDLSSIMTNSALGLNELIIDKINSVWIGSRRNGAYVFNENGNRKRALTVEPTKGSLPDPNVRTIAADKNNRIWIGTQKGLVVFYNASGLFDADIYDA